MARRQEACYKIIIGILINYCKIIQRYRKCKGLYEIDKLQVYNDYPGFTEIFLSINSTGKHFFTNELFYN